MAEKGAVISYKMGDDLHQDCTNTKKNARTALQPGVFWFLRSPANTGEPTNLTLGVLRTLARLAQTDLLTLNLTGIAGHKTSTTQGTAQRLVIIH